jgi:hypothetical protein
VSLILWLTLTPLVAALTHVVPPVSILIGPPTILLMSVALISGFFLLLLAPICWPAAQVCA